MSVVDNLTALAARDDWLWLVHHWSDLRGRLRPGGGNALTGMPAGGGDGHCPIDVQVSDLLMEVEDAARFYARVLLDETDDWAPTTSAMPGLMREMAMRYGHFTTDDTLALGFCDDGHELRRKATRVLERPAPPTYMGPCQADNCGGDVYARPGNDHGACRECKAEYGVLEQRAWLHEQMDTRLMTASEITSALHVITGNEVPHSTVKSWIRRRRLLEVGDGLYRLKDASELAEAARRG